MSELDSGPPSFGTYAGPSARAPLISATMATAMTTPTFGATTSATTTPSSSATTRSTTPSATTAIMSIAPTSARTRRDKTRSKLNRNAARTAAKAEADPLLDPRPRHPHHLLKAAKPIKAKFELRKIRIASTGWLSLRDDGESPEEKLAGVKERGPAPTHRLSNLFGPSAIFHGFTLVKSRGPCVPPFFASHIDLIFL